MKTLGQWLSEKSYRSTVVNLVMLTGVLAMSQSSELFMAVGGGAIAIASFYFLLRAIALTARTKRFVNPYQLSLIWIPGLLAIVLAMTGLYLVISAEPFSLGYCLGVILFACELAMLTIAGVDLDDSASKSSRIIEVV
ncbi:hypothetical protein [Chelatococcus asaccharovorans]|uniref:hypothetical protein n=1 Tax=Chelatococcus asaccharovorans TaxID=28210 RepID=UPI00224C790E|nr:hypothetical protein [Chelatococcus asaccharovorans]CAH1660756.1 conserved membrane hypothetical protein [Chelatococcus asaccharovorans]CAH1683685.1 conserved membrane hypothetical protein [Chelatococcus asaccharovorans]